MATNTQAELKDLQDQIKNLKDELAAQVKASASSSNIRDIAAQAGKTAGSYYADAKEHVGTQKETCENTIKSHPFASMAAAFLGGAAMALILRK